MALTGPTIGSLCTGYGGLDLAVEALTGGHTIWVSEIDGHASELLEQRFAVPNIGDLTSLTDQPEPVDILTAGFPCQPLSQAGHRKGVEDDRWIWDDILALIRRMEPRPRLLMLENVAGLLTANGGDAMARVVEGLASLGYMGSWRAQRASDIGACHRRERIFIVAALAGTDRQRVRSDRGADRRDESSGHRPAGAPVSAGPQVAHPADPQAGDRDAARLIPTPAASDGTRGPDLARADRPDSGGMDLVTTVERLMPTPLASEWRGRSGSEGTIDRVADAVHELLPTPTKAMSEGGNISRSGDRKDELLLGGILRHVDVFGVYADAVARHAEVTGIAPPAPTDGRRRLNPAFVEWMMMLPPGWVTSLELPRTAQLKLLGNGVVPPQAFAAYSDLITRLN